MRFAFAQPSMPRPAEILAGRAEPIVEPGPHFFSGRPIAGPYPAGTQVAEVAMGCFWGAEKKFWSIPGVWATAVGYQGGTTPNPTYPRGLHRADGPCGGRADRVRPRRGVV